MGTVDEPPQPRDFKKNRNMSTNSHNGPLTINIPSYSSPNPNQAINSPTMPNSKAHLQSPPNPNLLSSKSNGQYSTEPVTPKSPTYFRMSEDHKLIIEGVKLSMELIESKIPNHMGYAHLLLTRTLALISEMTNRTSRREISELLEKETREIEAERDMINSKMFAYELKGLEDWKKYLRGKFFE